MTKRRRFVSFFDIEFDYVGLSLDLVGSLVHGQFKLCWSVLAGGSDGFNSGLEPHGGHELLSLWV